MSDFPSFKEIYEQHTDMVFNLCLNYLQNEADAEEVTQDVFIKVYRQLANFKGQATLKTWIYRISINQCQDFLKAKKRQKRFGFHIPVLWGNPAEGLPVLSDFKHPGVQLEDKEAVAYIFKNINDLPQQQKTALLLKVVEDLSQKEIAAILDISIKAVESLLSRARSNLQKKLDASEG
ncbi:MAG: RNA polymerase sigma factor [Saprospiraceae bacterium]|nr:RNA polymerase sigma factor [Saprospiraceae bacterium]